MIFKHFRVQCTLRVLILGASIGVVAFLLMRTTHVVTALLLVGLIGYQIYALIHYVEQTNRELSRFFHAVEQVDFSQTFTLDNGTGPSFEALKRSLNDVLDAFRRTRAEKEAHLHYVQTVVQHVGSGLIVFQPDGEVVLINTAAKRLLRLPQLHHIQALEALSPTLVETLQHLPPGKRALVKIEDAQEPLQLAIHATAFRLQEQAYTLVSLQNIQDELDEKEAEAWQNLMRVLTHEIMNSITPIASLASTAHGLLRRQEPVSYGVEADYVRLDAETQQDLLDAVYTMQKRSEGLLHFVEAYRRLSRIPTPRFQLVAVTDVFTRLEQLLRSQFQTADIAFHTEVEPEGMEVTADPELMEQVLINLLGNAIESLQGQADGQVTLSARLDGTGRVEIRVHDNGPGIVSEALGKIFIPFFTTKPEGSGIGLSLSRQVMRLHHGTIRVQSQPGLETVFTLTF